MYIWNFKYCTLSDILIIKVRLLGELKGTESNRTEENIWRQSLKLYIVSDGCHSRSLSYKLLTTVCQCIFLWEFHIPRPSYTCSYSIPSHIDLFLPLVSSIIYLNHHSFLYWSQYSQEPTQAQSITQASVLHPYCPVCQCSPPPSSLELD